VTGISTDLVEFYERSAPYYDDKDLPAERRADLALVEAYVPPLLAGRRVLEVAAGTGMWTPLIAATAASVCATDAAPAMVTAAARRAYPRGNARFAVADALDLAGVDGDFDAAFAGFFFSHLRLADREAFLDGLRERLRPGSPVVLVDNFYAGGASSPIAYADDARDTYQRRELRDGTAYHVVKNFPTLGELRALGGRHGRGVAVVAFACYWALSFTTPG
jgi:ubiquinone/menaquinone biosynthesis C-methylase UbiE